MKSLLLLFICCTLIHTSQATWLGQLFGMQNFASINDAITNTTLQLPFIGYYGTIDATTCNTTLCANVTRGGCSKSIIILRCSNATGLASLIIDDTVLVLLRCIMGMSQQQVPPVPIVHVHQDMEEPIANLMVT
jgi:hypothetical protein